MSTINQQRRDAIDGLTAGIERIKRDLAARVAELKKQADIAIKEHRAIIAQHKAALRAKK